RDPYPVPKPVMDLLNAIVSVGIQGTIPIHAPTVCVERSSVKNMQSLARNHPFVRTVWSLVEPAQDLTGLRRGLAVDGFLPLHTNLRGKEATQGRDEQGTREKGPASLEHRQSPFCIARPSSRNPLPISHANDLWPHDLISGCRRETKLARQLRRARHIE